MRWFDGVIRRPAVAVDKYTGNPAETDGKFLAYVFDGSLEEWWTGGGGLSNWGVGAAREHFVINCHSCAISLWGHVWGHLVRVR